MNQRQVSTTSYPLLIYMVLSADGLPATGKTVTVTISKNGGAFGAASGAVAEIGNGWYSLAGNASDRDTLGSLAFRATATDCLDFPGSAEIVPWDPFDGVRMGMTALPNAAAGANGGLPLGNAAGKVTVVTNDDKTGYSLSSSGVQAIWDALTSALTTIGSIGKYIVDNLAAAVSSSSDGSADSDSFYQSIIESINAKIEDLVENPQVDYTIGNVSVSASDKMDQLIKLREQMLKRMVEKPAERMEVIQSDFSAFGENISSFVDEDPE